MHRSNDPHLLSGAKVHSSAVIVMPPKELWGPINAIRAVHDKAYERWMPHINMLYPFVPEKDFESWAPKLTAALSEFAPFELTFATVSSFSHGPSNTLFLQPDEAAKAVLKRIQARLEATVPICNDLSKIGAHGFTPHLTLGQWQGAASSKAAIANLNATWKPITFTVQELYCIARGRTTPFEVKNAISLKKSVPPPVPVVVAVPAAAEVAPIPAAAAAKAEKNDSANNNNDKKRGNGGDLDEDIEPICAEVKFAELTIQLDSKSDTGQIFKKIQSWYKVNKARKMLPKSRSKLENAIKPLCQTFEDVDPLGIWNLLLANGIISLTAANKVKYNIAKATPAEEPIVVYGEEPKKKTAHDLVFEKAKKWIRENRDPPGSADGLRNCIKQLCHHKHTVDSRKIVDWLIEQKLVEEANDQIVYHLEANA